tara:strand:- start:8343 stop:9209 length:867 start_codon:yes stop_codon:yes gene_type:complete
LGKKYIENRILLIGSGDWSKNYVKTIEKIDSSKLLIHIPARKALKELLKDKNKFVNKIEKEHINKVIICSTPENQYKILRLIHDLDLQLILEKPLFTNLEQKQFYEELPKHHKKKIIVNHFHFFSEQFQDFIKDVSGKKIKKLHIYDYGSGPIRKNIMPIFDWGPHPLGIISLLCPNFKLLNVKKLNKDLHQKWFIKLIGDPIKEIKVLTGNGFAKKKREIYVLDSNGNISYFKLNDSLHSESPMTSLLNFSLEAKANNHFYAKKTFNLAFMSCVSLMEINNFNKKSY